MNIKPHIFESSGTDSGTALVETGHIDPLPDINVNLRVRLPRAEKIDSVLSLIRLVFSASGALHKNLM